MCQAVLIYSVLPASDLHFTDKKVRLGEKATHLQWKEQNLNLTKTFSGQAPNPDWALARHPPFFQPAHSRLHSPVAHKQGPAPGFTALTETWLFLSVSPGVNLKTKPRPSAHPDAPPPGAATQGNFPALTLLFPGQAASGQRSAVRSSDPASPVLRCAPLAPTPGLPSSLSASIDSCCLLISRLSHTASFTPFIPAPYSAPTFCPGALSLAPRSLSQYCSPLPTLAFSKPAFAF